MRILNSRLIRMCVSKLTSVIDHGLQFGWLYGNSSGHEVNAILLASWDSTAVVFHGSVLIDPDYVVINTTK